MKAIVINELGSASVLKLSDVQNPTVKENEVIVNNKYVGVNYVDIYNRTGVYKKDLPFINGQEGSGIITEIGPGVKDFKVGDRVVYTNVNSAYAEYVSVPVNKMVKLPDYISFSEGAAVFLQGLTAHYLLTSTYPVTKGSKILIHSAAGGVGTLVVQIAKMLGAYVIGTVSNEKKITLVKELGADAVINYQTADFVKEVKRLTNNNGVDVVYDSVGKNTYPGSLDCIKPRGYFVLFGQSSGVIENFNPGILSAKGSLFMTRPTLGNYIATQKELTDRTKDLFNWMKQKKLKVFIDSEFSLGEASAAQTRLESRQSIGKVLLKV